MSVKDKERHYLPYDYPELTESLKVKAKVELHETEDKVRESLYKLKELIREKQIRVQTEDDFLILFLRCKKYDMKKAFDQVCDYSYQRHNLMRYYGFMFVDPIMPALHTNVCGILPKRDHEGRVIVYMRLCEFSPKNCHPDDVLRAMQVMGHYILTIPATQVSGMALLADLKVDSVEVLHLLFKYVRMAIPTVSSFPGRFQKIDCVNTNVIVRTFVNIMRPLVPSKLLKRTTFHGSDPKCLLKSYDPSLLPEEFGGTMGPISEASAKSILKLQEFIPRLQATNKFYKRSNSIPYPES